jgi:putative phage-type endonuclease
MIVLNVTQGSPEWLAIRATTYNASELSAAAGKSKYMTRDELLQQKKTGIAPDVDRNTQALFDRGHASEAAARPFAEEIIGEELSPTTGMIEIDGLKLLASFDGITFGDDFIFEHKLYGESLAAAVRAGELDEHYTIQMDQQLLISGASKCLFITSDGTKDKMEFCWYETTEEKKAAIVAIWKQFAKDLESYEPKAIPAQPKAEVVIELPALFVHAKGEITESNMKEFGTALATRLEEVRAIKLVTDQDFANAKGAAVMFRDQIKKLAQAKEAMLSQTVTIGEAARMIDAWSEDLRVTALQLEKDVEREDLEKKRAMINAATVAFNEHIAALEAETKPTRLNIQMPNFAGEIKGKRNYSSMQDAIDTALANSKISADAIAQDVRSKLAWCKANAEGYGFLFADMQQIIFKATDDFQLLVSSRIEQHKKAEDAKLEAERERIRLEEEAKAKAAAEEAARKAAAELEAKKAPEFATVALSIDTPAVADEKNARARQRLEEVSIATPVIIGVDMASGPDRTAVIDTGATMKLGQISELLGFSVTSEILHSLGIESVGKERAAILYREADFPRICACLIANINAACVDFIEGQRKAA